MQICKWKREVVGVGAGEAYDSTLTDYEPESNEVSQTRHYPRNSYDNCKHYVLATIHRVPSTRPYIF